MSALSVWKHRQHIFSRFAVALAHQEVSLLLQQLLGLCPGNGTVIPLLLAQRFLTSGYHIEKLKRDKTQEVKQRIWQVRIEMRKCWWKKQQTRFWNLLMKSPIQTWASGWFQRWSVWGCQTLTPCLCFYPEIKCTCPWLSCNETVNQILVQV